MLRSIGIYVNLDKLKGDLMKKNDDEIKFDLKRMYDKDPEGYGTDYETPTGNYFMWRKINTMLQLGHFKKGDKLLEVGCATGPYTVELAKLGFEMTGLDLSDNNINYAIKKSGRYPSYEIKFVVGDAENLLNFSDNTFDGVVSFSALRYVPNVQKAIDETFRVVKHGKTVVVDFPNKLSPWFNYIKPKIFGRKHIHDHSYTSSEIESFFKKAGFCDIKVKRILYTPKLTPPLILGLMKCLDFVGERTPIVNEFASIVMCRGVK